MVSLLALDEGRRWTTARWYRPGWHSPERLVQAMDDTGTSAPLWALTRGAVATDDSEILTSPVQAMVWGLGRVGGTGTARAVGRDGRRAPRSLTSGPGLACVRAAGRGREDQVAIRGAGVMARRVVHAEPPRDPVPWVPGGTVLITGGTGAVAGHVARWLAGRGAPRIVLASRSGATSPRAAAIVAELAGMGTAVEVIACDVADRAGSRAAGADRHRAPGRRGHRGQAAACRGDAHRRPGAGYPPGGDDRTGAGRDDRR